MNQATQAALDSLKDHMDKSGHRDSDLYLARLSAIIRSYADRWNNDMEDYEVAHVEKTYHAPIVNLDNGKKTKFLASGKLDVIARSRKNKNKIILIDHKSSSGEWSTDKHQHLLFGSQGLQYAYLAHANGLGITHIMFDVLQKSLHRKGKNESYPELQDRIYGIYSEDHSKFQRLTVPVIKDSVADHVNNLYHISKEIDLESKGGIHIPSTNSCFAFGNNCTYLPICSGMSDQNDETEWKTESNKHKELDLEDDLDPSLLMTNSRVNCYLSCRRQHNFKYNLGLAPVRENLPESLFLGTAIHIALENYWKTLMIKGEN